MAPQPLACSPPGPSGKAPCRPFAEAGDGDNSVGAAAGQAAVSPETHTTHPPRTRPHRRAETPPQTEENAFLRSSFTSLLQTSNEVIMY